MRTVSTLFSKKFLGAIFSKIMKTHARVEVRKTGEKDENRDLEHGKVFRKNQKSAQKRFFRRAARLFFENSALCPADHQKTTRQHYVKKITYERLFIYPTSDVKIGVLTPQKIGLLQKSTFRVYYKTAFRHFSAV